MNHSVKVLLFFLTLVITISLFASSKQVLEFKVNCPDGMKPHGICFAEYNGEEIIVCCLWEEQNDRVKFFQGYDYHGRQLQISQEKLEKCMERVLAGVKFKRRFMLKKQSEPLSLSLLDKRIQENGECCAPYGEDKLPWKNVVWKMPFANYCNNEKASVNDFFCPEESVAFQTSSKGGICPVFTSSALITFQPKQFQFHIWGIDGTNGKELAHYYTPKRKYDTEFLPMGAWLDSSMQHIVVLGKDRNNINLLRFYDSKEEFSCWRHSFQYYAPNKLHIPPYERPFDLDAERRQAPTEDSFFFLSSDMFCFLLDDYGEDSPDILWAGPPLHKMRAVLYSFSKKNIVADVSLSGRDDFANCIFAQPWCDVSLDGKRLVIGFEQVSRICAIRRGDPFRINMIRIYELKP